MAEKQDKKVAALLKADEAYHAHVRQHDRYSITVNAGFPDKADDPAKVIDEAIYRGLCILAGTHLMYLRLVSVTTTIMHHSYEQYILVTVIAEPLPLRSKRKVN